MGAGKGGSAATLLATRSRCSTSRKTRTPPSDDSRPPSKPHTSRIAAILFASVSADYLAAISIVAARGPHEGG